MKCCAIEENAQYHVMLKEILYHQGFLSLWSGPKPCLIFVKKISTKYLELHTSPHCHMD